MNGRKLISLLIAASLVLLVIVSAVVVLSPQGRLSESMADADVAVIFVIELTSQDGEPKNLTAEYELRPDDPAFAELFDILDGYKWHRCFHSGNSGAWSFGSDKLIRLEFSVAGGLTDIFLAEKAHILLDGQPVRLDYLGSKKAESLFAQVEELLENCTPLAE